MIRWPDYKEAVAWLRENAQGPTGFYLWGSIYVRRALWDGFSWRWLTDAEQRNAGTGASHD
jgi:hypothetical protein